MNGLTRLSNWLIGKTSLRRTLVSAAILVATLIAMEASPIGKRALEVASGGRGMLDMRFSYSADYAISLFGDLGDAGRLLYVRLLALDVFFAFAFMAFQTFLLSALVRRSAVGTPLSLVNLLPALRSALDLGENALLMTSIAMFPGASGAAISVLLAAGSAVTSAKWVVYYGVIASLALLGARATMRPKEKTA